MKDDIKRAYSKVGMSEADKLVVLNNIKTRTKRRNTRYIAWAAAAVVAAAAIVVAFALGGATPNKSNTIEIAAEQPEETISQTPMCTAKPSPVFAVITLSINPSVEFRLDEEGFVIEVVGTNEDGIALVEGLDAEELSLENATILVVNRLIENGYITDSSIIREITLTIDSGDFEIDTLNVMSGIIKTAASAYDIEVDVIQADDVNGVNIMLAGTESTPKPTGTADQTPHLTPPPSQTSPPEAPVLADVMPPEQTRTILFDYDSGKPGNIWLTGDDNVRHDFVRFIVKDTKEIVMHGLAYLIDTGFIVDPYAADTSIEYELRLSEPTDQRLKETYDVATMMIEESGIMLEVTKQSFGVSIYLACMGKPPRDAEYTMNEILNTMFLKDRALITEQQMQILEYVYTDEEIEQLLGMPMRFVVLPNVEGLTGEKAVKLLEQAGMTVQIEYFYNPLFEGKTGTVTFQCPQALSMFEIGRECYIEVQIGRPEGHRIADSYVPVNMSIEDYEAYLFENDLIQAHLDLESIGMPPAMMEEEYGPISKAEYDMYNEVLEKIGVELRYLLPWEKDEYFGSDEETGGLGCNGYPEPKPTETIEE